ncbi:MAG: tRNA (adenosine(37)-N6)-dimethylallyltransferase MiaA [Opitutaceae bacterium]|jgi:tRNA dimethylallyltransferase|nr:tRNA (adenosine(37)-N6)-dimethylallyltransferase MiaA [Opitutaceae bacterium]
MNGAQPERQPGQQPEQQPGRTEKPPLYILTGPTAVGKTELALRWAETNGAEIVSCDSLLFYRGMDIGTAKPSREEQARVRHHLVDICEPREAMDITRFVALARVAVEDIAARGRRVLVTGGSGFYLKAFFAPVADNVAVPPAIRDEVARQLAKDGLPSLVARLLALNPGLEMRSGGKGGETSRGKGEADGTRPPVLDTANPRRVTRSLERCLASGRTLAELAAEFARQPGPFADWSPVCVRLEREPAELDARIAWRVEQMLQAGLVDEVARMDAAGFRQNPSAARAIGYRETLAMLDRERECGSDCGGAATEGNTGYAGYTGQTAQAMQATRAELAAEVIRNTRALVKKQRTWFRTQLPEHRIMAAPTSEAEATAMTERLF